MRWTRLIGLSAPIRRSTIANATTKANRFLTIHHCGAVCHRKENDGVFTVAELKTPQQPYPGYCGIDLMSSCYNQMALHAGEPFGGRWVTLTAEGQDQPAKLQLHTIAHWCGHIRFEAHTIDLGVIGAIQVS